MAHALHPGAAGVEPVLRSPVSLLVTPLAASRWMLGELDTAMLKRLIKLISHCDIRFGIALSRRPDQNPTNYPTRLMYTNEGTHPTTNPRTGSQLHAGPQSAPSSGGPSRDPWGAGTRKRGRSACQWSGTSSGSTGVDVGRWTWFLEGTRCKSSIKGGFYRPAVLCAYVCDLRWLV